MKDRAFDSSDMTEHRKDKKLSDKTGALVLLAVALLALIVIAL